MIQVTIAPEYYPEVIGEARTRVEALAVLGEWYLHNADRSFMHPALRCSECQWDITNATDRCRCTVVVDGTPAAAAVVGEVVR